MTSARFKIFTKSLIIRSCNELDHQMVHEDPWGFNKVVNFSFGKANMKFCSNNWRDWGSLKGLSFHITVLALCQDLLNNDVDGGYALLNKNKKLITIKHSSHLRILNHLSLNYLSFACFNKNRTRMKTHDEMDGTSVFLWSISSLMMIMTFVFTWSVINLWKG